MAEKGLVNQVLDQSRGFIVWITNRLDGVDPSTRRRFDYSIEFERLTFEQRRAIWRSALRRYRLSRSFTTEQVDAFAADYESSAGGIDIALRNCARIRREQGGFVDLVPVVGRLMRAHLKILGQDRKREQVSRAAAKSYSVEGLNVRGDLAHTLSVLDRFNEYWSRPVADTEIRTMNLLLYGPPGTGKTELAKYVARRLERRLLVKRASDLLSMWVGQTEKSIRDAFREAERDRAVLLIDEADSMLGARAGAHASWEVSQVNELLCAMETFCGMLICSTNFKTGLDPAALRRFTLKLELDYLKPGGNLVFYRRFMEALVPAPLTVRERQRIEAMTHLTPGDFKVVYQSNCFVDKRDLTHGRLIDALGHEVACKNDGVGKKMGFGKNRV
jgi:SpoVK/Ycf46/Vps4 family AAA+-type ATPase